MKRISCFALIALLFMSTHTFFYLKVMGIISNIELNMLDNYRKGKGNIQLSKTSFAGLKSCIQHSHNFREQNGTAILLSDGSKGKSFIVSLYSSSEFDHAFGTATIYVDENFEIVGFMDIYDFDSRPWGERSYKAELLSRFIKFIAPKKAKPFKTTYGLQYSPPIYDKLTCNYSLSVS